MCVYRLGSSASPPPVWTDQTSASGWSVWRSLGEICVRRLSGKISSGIGVRWRSVWSVVRNDPRFWWRPGETPPTPTAWVHLNLNNNITIYWNLLLISHTDLCVCVELTGIVFACWQREQHFLLEINWQDVLLISYLRSHTHFYWRLHTNTTKRTTTRVLDSLLWWIWFWLHSTYRQSAARNKTENKYLHSTLCAFIQSVIVRIINGTLTSLRSVMSSIMFFWTPSRYGVGAEHTSIRTSGTMEMNVCCHMNGYKRAATAWRTWERVLNTHTHVQFSSWSNSAFR